MAQPALDRDLLATHLRTKIDSEGKSIRAASDEIGCSAATLSRMLRGSRAANFPDTRNLFRVASWLGKSITDFEYGVRTASSTLADVEVHLRALPGLSDEDKEAIVAMVKALHDAAVKARPQEG